MTTIPPPKAVLFDIGGVCVVSPFQAILDYEVEHSIPPGYINHTISRTAPNGAWQKIERGEIPLDDTFFSLFASELSSPDAWKAYWQKILADPKRRQTLPRSYRDGTKTEIPAVPNINAKEMFWNMMRMARSPDPWMYPALIKLRESGKFLVAALSNTIAFPEGIKDEKGAVFLSGVQKELEQMAPRLVQKKERIVELGSPEANGGVGDERQDLREIFEVFVSSAHVGMRKPERRIYELAVKEVQMAGKKRGIDIAPSEILFLDDIGHNLKAAKEVGMRTLKVLLGRTKDAVVQLEKEVEIPLLQDVAKL